MDILNYVLVLVITCMILVPALSFLFSWCCSIYFTRMTKYVADIAGALAKIVNGMTITAKKEQNNDPS